MNTVGWDILIVLVIVLIGGFFAAAEMALVSLRDGQVRSLARRGKRGQRAARLAQNPNRFLSAVQIGVTLATLLSGAFGAATLASDLKSWLAHNHVSDGLASAISIAVVTLAISFFTLVFGELAPKRLALQRIGAGIAVRRADPGPDRDDGHAAGLAAVQVRSTSWSRCSAATRASAAAS